MRIPAPAELGFLPKFKEWRPRQIEFIRGLLECDKQYVSRLMRVGAGKTAAYMAYAKMMGYRTMVLTGTLGLQKILLDDFECIGMREIKGKGNYMCGCLPGKTCEDGQIGKCHYKGSTLCTWSGAKDEALNAPYVTANYACWIAAQKYGVGFGSFDLLVADEAHSAESWLNKAMQVQVSEHECATLKFSWPDAEDRNDMDVWKVWGIVAASRAEVHLQALEEKLEKAVHPPTALINEAKRMKNLQRKLTDLAACTPDKWVVEKSNWGYQFDPISSAEYASRYLFAGIGKVLLVSGTIRPKTLEMMGLGPDEYDFEEYMGDVDPRKSPLVYIPTAKIWRDSSEFDLMQLVERIDETIEIWGEYRGLIQTGNFKLRDYIKENSAYGKYMITNYAENGDVTAEVVERFKRTKPPVILLSPSIHTGYDFEGACARWNVIAKVLFINDKTPIERARRDEDPERGFHLAIQNLEQEHGRSNRGGDDWSVSMIFDNNCEWLIRHYGHLASADFRACYTKSRKIPLPPPDGMALG